MHAGGGDIERLTVMADGERVGCSVERSIVYHIAHCCWSNRTNTKQQNGRPSKGQMYGTIRRHFDEEESEGKTAGHEQIELGSPQVQET